MIHELFVWHSPAQMVAGLLGSVTRQAKTSAIVAAARARTSFTNKIFDSFVFIRWKAGQRRGVRQLEIAPAVVKMPP